MSGGRCGWLRGHRWGCAFHGTTGHRWKCEKCGEEDVDMFCPGRAYTGKESR